MAREFSITITSDEDLIERFKAIVGDIAFIGFRYSAEIWGEKKKKNITHELVDGLHDKDLTKQTASLKRLWKHLLSDAIVFLKYKDAREKSWHDSFAIGVNRLSNLFDTLGGFERSFSPITTRVRDHIAHVMRVFMLGIVALKEVGIDGVDCGELRLSDGPVNDELKIEAEEKEAMWCIIALCHDLGLAMENVFQVNQEARKLFDRLGRISVRELEYGLSPMFQHMCYNTLKLISSTIDYDSREGPPDTDNNSAGDEQLPSHRNDSRIFRVHTQYKFYQKFLSALDDYDHGVLSCIILIKNLVYFLEADFLLDDTRLFTREDARQFLIRRTILRAIASHNCDSIYHLSIMTFPFLLTLFDEMQEWDRARPYMTLQDNVLKAELEIKCLSPERVEFELKFKEGDDETNHSEVYRYVKRKFAKFSKILRSAVSTSDRKLNFIFTITDSTQDPEWTYQMKHTSPSPRDITIQFPNHDSWYEFIRREFADDFGEQGICEDEEKSSDFDWFYWLDRQF